jgi:hypothetical protein
MCSSGRKHSCHKLNNTPSYEKIHLRKGASEIKLSVVTRVTSVTSASCKQDLDLASASSTFLVIVPAAITVKRTPRAQLCWFQAR